MSHIHRQINHGTLYAPRHEEAFLPYMQKTSSVASLPRPCLLTSREVNEARQPHTCSRPCAFEEKKKKRKKHGKKSALPKTHRETHISPATATTSRQLATKRAPHVCPCSPAYSIDRGFVEIGLVQLSQSVRTTNVTHTQTN